MCFVNLKCICGRGSAPDPTGGAYSTPHRAIFKWEGLIGSDCPPPKVLGILTEFVAKRCVLIAINASKCICSQGFVPNPISGAYSTLRFHTYLLERLLSCLPSSFNF